MRSFVKVKTCLKEGRLRYISYIALYRYSLISVFFLVWREVSFFISLVEMRNFIRIKRIMVKANPVFERRLFVYVSIFFFALFFVKIMSCFMS